MNTIDTGSGQPRGDRRGTSRRFSVCQGRRFRIWARRRRRLHGRLRRWTAQVPRVDRSPGSLRVRRREKKTQVG